MQAHSGVPLSFGMLRCARGIGLAHVVTDADANSRKFNKGNGLRAEATSTGGSRAKTLPFWLGVLNGVIGAFGTHYRPIAQPGTAAQ